MCKVYKYCCNLNNVDSKNMAAVLESRLPDLIRKIALCYNSHDFLENPDFLEKRNKKWHQFGILEHTKRVRNFFNHDLEQFLKKWGLDSEISSHFSERIDKIERRILFDISIVLHDLGKIPAYEEDKDKGTLNTRSRNHEIYSEHLIRENFLDNKLTELGLSESHKKYIACCVGTHGVLGKEIRDSLKGLNAYLVSNLNSSDVLQKFDEISKKYHPFETELGIFYLCDSKAKIDIEINSDEADFLCIERVLRERGLPLELKEGIKQIPINLKLSELYLKRIYKKL